MQQLVISFHGEQLAPVLTPLLKILGAHEAQLLDLRHLRLSGNLSLMAVAASPPHQIAPLETAIRQLASELGVHAHLNPPHSTAAPAHRYILTMLGAHLEPDVLHPISRYLNERGLHVMGVAPLEAEELKVYEFRLASEEPIAREPFMIELLDLRLKSRTDFALQVDDAFRRHKRLIVFDADMTFIQCEVIDELGRLAGAEEAIQAITHQAMEGTLDFQQALRERVRLLKGLPVEELHRLAQRLPYTPGVQRLVHILKTLGYQVALISGGFDLIIQHIVDQFQLDYGFANQLEVQDGRLTGEVQGAIVDGARKAALIEMIRQQEGLCPEQVIAVGDGANDLQMLTQAGLGIAFNAKRFLRERVSSSLTQPNLDAILYFLGFSRHELEALQKDA